MQLIRTAAPRVRNHSNVDRHVRHLVALYIAASVRVPGPTASATLRTRDPQAARRGAIHNLQAECSTPSSASPSPRAAPSTSVVFGQRWRCGPAPAPTAHQKQGTTCRGSCTPHDGGARVCLHRSTSRRHLRCCCRRRTADAHAADSF